MSKTQLFLRQESADLATAGEDAEKSLEIQQAVAENVEQVESASGAVTEVETGIDNALEAEGEVAAAVDTMEEAEKEGGMTPREAELVEARLERACRLLGADMSALGLTMRRESFGAAGSRLATTKMKREAAEGLGKRIWESLKKAWRWVKDFATSLFTKLVKSSTGVRDRAKDLQARLSKVSSGAKNNKDNLSAGAGFFSVGGKSGYSEITTVVDAVGKIGQLFIASVDLTDPQILKSTMASGKVPSLADSVKIAAGVENALSALGDGGTIKDLADGSVNFGKLPGQKTVLMETVKVPVGDAEYAFVKASIASTEGDLAKEYKALTLGELKEVAKQALAIGEALVAYEKQKQTLHKTMDANIKYCEDLAKISEAKNGASDSEAEKKANKEFFSFMRGYMGQNQSIAKLLANALPTMQFDTAVKACDVVAAGISNFKAEEKK